VKAADEDLQLLLAQAKQDIKLGTRQYASKQRKWIKNRFFV